MMTFLCAIQLLTVQPIMAPAPERLFRIDVVLYQGDPSGKLQLKEKLSSPQIMTRENQKAVISVGQNVAFIELEKTLVKDNAIQHRVVQEQVGATMTFNPQLMNDGQILLAGSIKTLTLGNMTDTIQQKVENDVRVAIPCKPNTTVTVPLYNPNDKPFTGKELWMELKVWEHISEKK